MATINAAEPRSAIVHGRKHFTGIAMYSARCRGGARQMLAFRAQRSGRQRTAAAATFENSTAFLAHPQAAAGRRLGRRAGRFDACTSGSSCVMPTPLSRMCQIHAVQADGVPRSTASPSAGTGRGKSRNFRPS